VSVLFGCWAQLAAVLRRRQTRVRAAVGCPFPASKEVVLRFHKTNIVRINRDGKIILQTGGWYTAATGAHVFGRVRVCCRQCRAPQHNMHHTQAYPAHHSAPSAWCAIPSLSSGCRHRSR
jgi:hypothetical protein